MSRDPWTTGDQHTATVSFVKLLHRYLRYLTYLSLPISRSELQLPTRLSDPQADHRAAGDIPGLPRRTSVRPSPLVTPYTPPLGRGNCGHLPDYFVVLSAMVEVLEHHTGC